MNNTYFYPRVNKEHKRKLAESYTVLSTVVRVLRNGVWYDIPVCQEFLIPLHTSDTTVENMERFIEQVYTIINLWKLSDLPNRFTEHEVSKSQISEVDRLMLLRLIPLHGLNNLI